MPPATVSSNMEMPLPSPRQRGVSQPEPMPKPPTILISPCHRTSPSDGASMDSGISEQSAECTDTEPDPTSTHAPPIKVKSKGRLRSLILPKRVAAQPSTEYGSTLLGHNPPSAISDESGNEYSADENAEASRGRASSVRAVHAALSRLDEGELRTLVEDVIDFYPDVEHTFVRELVHRRRTVHSQAEGSMCANCGVVFDTSAVQMGSECTYHPGDLEQEMFEMMSLKDRTASGVCENVLMWSCCGGYPGGVGCTVSSHLNLRK